MRTPLRLAGLALPAAVAATFGSTSAAMTPARVEVLPNGLTVLMVEDHTRPLIAVCTHVDGGSRTERDSEKGLSHYYEHTIFRGGTAKQAELETRKVFRELGDFGGYTTDDHTTYYMVVPTARLDDAFTRYADALLGLEVTEEKIERDRQSVVQEYAMRVSDSPAGQAWTQLYATAFTRHPYRLTPIGRLDVISTAKLDAFKSFYQERYVPNQMVLAVVGDFAPEDMLRRIRSSFGARPAGRLSFELGEAEPAQTEWRESAIRAPSKLVYGTLGFKVPALADPDSAALRVLDALLLSGRSSRLWRALKERKPLAVDLWSDPNPRRDPTLWVFGFSVRPEDEAELVRTLLGEIGRLAREEVPAAELARARALLERDLRFETETPLARAVRLADYAVKRALPLEARAVDDVLSVGPERLRATAARYLTWAGATLVLVRPQTGGAPEPPSAGVGPAASYREIAHELLAPSPAPAAASAVAGTARMRRLPSRLRLVERPEPGSGIVALVAAVPGGLWLDAPDRWGASSLLARCLTRGTADLSEEDLGAALDGLGARVSASAEEDLTTVTLTAPASTLARALPLLLDVLFRPRLGADAVERARKEAAAELKAIADDSFTETNVEFRRRLFGDLPYAHPVLGEPSALARLGPAELRALHERAFVPENVVLAAAGDFEPEALAAALESAAAARPALPAPAPGLPAEFAPTRKLRVDLDREHSQATYDFGRLVPGLGDASSLALRIAARALGSRLFFRWVYEEGMAYRMWTRYTPLLGPSPFWFEMGVDPQNLSKALGGVSGEVGIAAREGFTRAEVDSARESLIQSHLLDQQTAVRRATGDARNEALGLGADFSDRMPALLREVTVEGVDRAIAAAADPGRSVTVVLGPPQHAVVPDLPRHDED